MKTEIGIVFVGIFLILGISFFVFNIQKYNLTGFAVANSSLNSNESVNESIVITKEMAIESINESEQIIIEMQENNFSTLYMNDSLIEARKVFQQAIYAEILRGDVNSSEQEKLEAQRALAVVNWRKISYADVLSYTDEIKQRREKAFLLMDEITIEENKMSLKENNFLSNETKHILENAEIAFHEDRFQDAEKLIIEFRTAFEQKKAESSSLLGIGEGGKNFFQRYWIYLIILLIVFVFGGYFIYKKFEKKIIKTKIKKMKAEEEVLTNLMKKVQEDRFKKNTISGLVYNIRMKKYQERLQEIKQELPVLESRITKKH